MTPGSIPFATRALGKPQNWDIKKHGECLTLEIRDRDGMMQSAWYPSVDEIALMIAGQPVVLTVWSLTHPPVSLNVEDKL